MKKILSPLMAAALVTGLTAGLAAFADDHAAPADDQVAAAPAPAKKDGKKGHHHMKHDKKKHGDMKNGCKGEDGKAGCSGDDHDDAPKADATKAKK